MSAFVLSLFPGIGLLDHAFVLEGFCTVRGPDLIWGGDVRTFRPPPQRFDGIIGGPPCQSFSALANLVRARGYEPAFGNLIPEFERVVAETAPRWFLMENVPKAPVPVVSGYAVHSFVLCNSALGEPQIRLRRWSFGVLGETPVNLQRWIDKAALKLPKRAPAVTASADLYPVRLGGSGKLKTTLHAAVLVSHGGASAHDRGTLTQTVTARSAGKTAPKGGKFPHYSLADVLLLQGLPEDFLDHCPFTVQGKRKAIGNGVPIPMGRALARAVRAAIDAGLTTPLQSPP